MRTRTEKRVFWFDDGKRPNVADALEETEKDILVHRLAFNGPPADIWGAISSSQAYCITSTRQELPEDYMCNAALIARCPDLLVVSTSGAGYDTVDVAACTAEGVLVVNQTGANADAVSEHAVAMMLSLTKNIPQTDRALRAGVGGKREVFKGRNARSVDRRYSRRRSMTPTLLNEMVANGNLTRVVSALTAVTLLVRGFPAGVLFFFSLRTA